jgi:ribulose-phosphate 3-epimerase
MLAADFLHLEKDVEMVNENADLFHLDIMDGVFVPNISYGFPVVEAIAKMARKPLDTHLMIVEPEKYVERFVKAGSAMVSFHLNATKDPDAVLAKIKITAVVVRPCAEELFIGFKVFRRCGNAAVAVELFDGGGLFVGNIGQNRRFFIL